MESGLAEKRQLQLSRLGSGRALRALGRCAQPAALSHVSLKLVCFMVRVCVLCVRCVEYCIVLCVSWCVFVCVCVCVCLWKKEGNAKIEKK